MSTKPQPQRQKVTAPYDRSSKDPTVYTIDAYERVMQQLNFLDARDYDDARYGFMATLTADGQVTKEPVVEVKIKSDDPKAPLPIWNLGQYAFIKTDPAPHSVNPSLWRQAQLNLNNGLFRVKTRTYSLNGNEVTREIFQVRGFDLSNMTIVETDNGIIVIDPLISAETARTALNLYYQCRPTPDRPPVLAVIFTHSHVDHYGGVKGIVTDEDIRLKKVQVYAPSGFLEHAVSENVYAGNAMYRRSIYMYGTLLPKGDKSQVDSGLGKTTSMGHSGLISAFEIATSPYEDSIDGVKFTCHLAPETEAPSEMLIYFPQFSALCAAEDMTHNLHNLYSLRGAQVRNAAAWWKTINNAINVFKDAQVLFAQHHWPIWNDPPDNIRHFLQKQRDLYKFIHDQSLRLLNNGRTMIDLAEMVVLPKSLSAEWYNRDYYGTVNHDSKAVYQRYLGWYDANPATLHSLPREEAAKKYVEYMGGAQAVLDRAKLAFDKGDYRWVAEVVNHVIFATPESANPNPIDPVTLNAKLLQADTLEQLGYQAESGPWRNAYLTGAHELRWGVSAALKSQPLSIDVMSAMTLDQYFDLMGLQFDAATAMADPQFVPLTTINWNVKNTGTGNTRYYAQELIDYTLPYTAYPQASDLPPADVTVTLERNVLNEISTDPDLTISQAFTRAVTDGRIFVQGDVNRVTAILDLLHSFPADFDIVTPRKPTPVV